MIVRTRCQSTARSPLTLNHHHDLVSRRLPEARSQHAAAGYARWKAGLKQSVQGGRAKTAI
ncbi:hypothetical protein J4734_24330 [Klebsiella pneumoniae]|uniref:Uncharacterized protein n=1 Tax=Klebsiella pneumoniae TaxID=573 RepID=A0A939NSB7_KLEPN|nr:hypothetical protein [Klebsiella pneumoniae]